jgi:hypothetical protein
MNFDPYNCPMKIWESFKTPIPKMGIHLGVWRFIFSHSPKLSGAWMWLLASLLAFTFESPCPGHKLKVRVVIVCLQESWKPLWKLSLL